jgi:hypothetical protein
VSRIVEVSVICCFHFRGFTLKMKVTSVSESPQTLLTSARYTGPGTESSAVKLCSLQKASSNVRSLCIADEVNANREVMHARQGLALPKRLSCSYNGSGSTLKFVQRLKCTFLSCVLIAVSGVFNLSCWRTPKCNFSSMLYPQTC